MFWQVSAEMALDLRRCYPSLWPWPRCPPGPFELVPTLLPPKLAREPCYSGPHDFEQVTRMRVLDCSEVRSSHEPRSLLSPLLILISSFPSWTGLTPFSVAPDRPPGVPC